MKNYILGFLSSIAIILPVYASETPASSKSTSQNESSYGLRANFKKAAFEFSSTEVKNSEEYQDSPNSQLSGDSETLTKGLFDFILEYEQEKYQWNNSLFMTYGRTKVKPVEGPNVINEVSDKILLTSDYARKIWRIYDADMGPFANIGYQTEFSPNDDAPRTKIFRGKSGIKLFNGKYVKEVYIAAVSELDMTYNEDTKGAYEIGFDAKVPLKDNVDIEVTSYFRDYVLYSDYEPTDFTYEFGFVSRMMVNVYKNIYIGPYIQYFQAKDKESDKYGSNTIIGITISYSKLWNI